MPKKTGYIWVTCDLSLNLKTHKWIFFIKWEGFDRMFWSCFPLLKTSYIVEIFHYQKDQVRLVLDFVLCVSVNRLLLVCISSQNRSVKQCPHILKGHELRTYCIELELRLQVKIVSEYFPLSENFQALCFCFRGDLWPKGSL